MRDLQLLNPSANVWPVDDHARMCQFINASLLTAKNRDQLRNPTLRNRVTLPFFSLLDVTSGLAKMLEKNDIQGGSKSKLLILSEYVKKLGR